MRVTLKIFAAALLFGVFALTSANAAVIYADTLTASQDVIFFGSGVLTGAPDNGGAFLSNTGDPPTNLGFVILKFTGGLMDGVGPDLHVFDCCAANGISGAGETFDLFVSANNIAYTLIGGFGNGVNDIDIAGQFAGPFFYVKVVNTSRTDSPDIDAVQGNFAAAASTPEPATQYLVGLGLVAAALVARRVQR